MIQIKQKIIYLLAIVILISACTKDEIRNFDECVAAGNPVMESYPPRCSANGKTFTQDVTDITQQVENKNLCGGWDTYGEVVCGCNGELVKDTCPEGVQCDSGNYYCFGECRDCRCFQGSMNDGNEEECDGRDELFLENTIIPSDTASRSCTAAEKKAKECTLEYAPVCGNDGITYGNKCGACASGKIDSYVPGECTSEDGRRNYLSKDVEECSRMGLWLCDDNLQPFSDEAGCGCELIS